jgi:hypothetical protein
MKLLLEAPINRLSFGNVSYNFIRELRKLDVDLGIFPIGDLNQLDLSAFDPSEDTKKYIEDCINKRWDYLDPCVPSLKLWHLNGSENRKNPSQYLYTFYECNKPTQIEKQIALVQDKIIFSSKYAADHFREAGVELATSIPLGFDEDFFRTEKTYLKDTIHFGLMGKFERRKHTQSIIRTWLKKYGNNNKYQLTCCINNPFFNDDQMRGVIADTLQGHHFNNINFLPTLEKNSEVNELLNSIDIDLTGLSGGEGWNLPAFNATCLGKWSVVLNATSHKDWATEKNSILVEPKGEMPVEDGVFFASNSIFNNGTFHLWDENEVVSAMEKAVEKAGQLNTEGQKLAEEMSYTKTVEQILAVINA